MNSLIHISYSDPYFYSKVMGRYQKVRINPLYLPVMIFRKYPGDILSRTIEAKFEFHLHLHNLNLSSSIIAKKIRWIRALSGIMRFMHQSIYEPLLLRGEDTVHETLQKKSLGFLRCASYGPHPRTETPHFHERIRCPEPQGARNCLSKQKEYAWRYSFGLLHTLPEVLTNSGEMSGHQVQAKSRENRGIPEGYKIGSRIRGRLIQTKTGGTIYANMPLSDRPIRDYKTIMNPSNLYQHRDGFNYLVPLLQGRCVKEDQRFYFREDRKIEHTLGEIRKIAEEARETAVNNAMSYSQEKKNINQHIDMSRLSYQVYKLIDRELKIEKERRGYF